MTASGRHRATGPARPARSWRRRTALGVVSGGVALLGAGGTGLVTAHAAGAPGSGFGNIDITATATGIRAPGYSHTGEDVEAQVPYASSTLQSGGVADALTSVFWPGGTGGHGGDTLKLLAGSCLPPNPGNTVPIPLPLPPLPCAAHVPTFPDSAYQAMNDSYKAEAQSGAGKPSQTTTGPGLTMAAKLTASLVSAATEIAGGKVPAVSNAFGTTTSATTIKLQGTHTAIVDAVSTVRDVSIGGGALTISSVRSTAHAVTNGKTASGNAITTVTGMKVGGVPVTVDNSGIHVQGKGSKLPSLDALNSMLNKAGIAIYVANPTKQVKGASAQLFSGQLIVQETNPQYMSNANDTGQIMTFGGAVIQATTGKGFVYKPPPLPSVSPPPVTSTGSVPPPTSTGTTTGTGGGAPLPGPQVAGNQPPAVAPVLAAQRSSLPGGISPTWIVLVLLGSGLIAAGLKRLPDEVLAQRGAACPLGETT
ncbi:MAG: hypothetical protein JO222_03370 [Frankiales bacterium]|nr:hypothetical protein [Frankiales bacterium]